MIAALRSALFALIFYPGTLLYVLAILASTPFGPRGVRFFVHAWAKFHYWLVRKILGIRFVWDGEIPPGPYLIAVKHQAMVEAVDTLRFAYSPVVVMKRELSHMPLWGNAARAYGVIGVDREAGAKALRAMIAAARSFAGTGRPLAIFPEGTRIATGERAPLQAGFAGLYKLLGVPVVPVALNSGLFWGRRKFIKWPGVIDVEILPAIPPGLAREEFMVRLRERIESATQRLARREQN